MRYLFVLLFFFGLQHISAAKEAWDEQAFRDFNPAERYRFVHDYPFWKMSSGAKQSSLLGRMLVIAEAKKDHHSVLAIKYYLGQIAGNEGFSMPGGRSVRELHQEIETEAKKRGFEVEEVVAHHYLSNDLSPANKLSYEERYVEVQKTFERMRAIGFEKFKDYGVDAILFNLNHFMWELGDFEQAFQYLSVEERFIQPTVEGGHHYTQALSYLQTYWKRKKDFKKSIQYAEKILHFHQKFKPNNPDSQWWNRFWKGFAAIEIADLLTEQVNFNQSEHFANLGYTLSKVQEATDAVAPYQAEYDALQVLISVKLKFSKLDEVETLLNRATFIKEKLEPLGQLEYFKPLRLYQHYSNYYELRGQAVEALRYTHLAQTLQDSLDRKNDARKLTQIQLRFEAEKHAEQLHLLEKEKQLQQKLGLSAFAILLILMGWRYQYFRAQRRQKEIELSAAKASLEALTQGFREKSELVENLRLENEKLAQQGKHSDYLEQLTTATILTEADWTKFRGLFEKVHPGFIAAQKEQFPDLTHAETRLLVLEKLGLSTADMANMLGVNKNTIHQTRLRLRRKMEAESP
ncbi:hypothetical protein [Haliscomenobacter sp.]|uniref:hypothetical protein n=1 Tax=Haliscomenobacter sp. TaxID=2717303 RepID=UPI003BA9273B